jgi:hypothetical protein
MSMNGMGPGQQLNEDEMQRVLLRNRFSLQMLGERIGLLTRENVEMMSIVQELQGDLMRARQALAEINPEHPLLPAGMIPPQ